MKGIKGSTFIVCFLLVGCFFSAKGFAFSEETFFQGVAAYEKGEYLEAKDHFGQLLIEGPNGAVYYNLGNTYSRLGEKAKAIFFFKSALRFFSMNGDLHYNLQYLRSDVVDKISDNRGMTVDKISLKIPLTLEKLFIILSLSVFLFSLISTIELFKRSEWLKWSKNALVLLFLFSFPMTLIKYFDHRPFGVVVSKEASIYSGVGKDNVILFSLHEGAEFWISDIRKNEWYQIDLNDGKKGWIRSKDVITNETKLF